MTSVLSVKEAVWSALSTPTIDEHIRLKNLQALFIILKGDDPFENDQAEETLIMNPIYKVELSDSLQKAIEESVKQHYEFYRNVFLPDFEHFVKQLADNSYPLTSTIRELVTAIYFMGEEERMNDFIADPTLTLDHTYSFYVLLHKCLSG